MRPPPSDGPARGRSATSHSCIGRDHRANALICTADVETGSTYIHWAVPLTWFSSPFVLVPMPGALPRWPVLGAALGLGTGNPGRKQ